MFIKLHALTFTGCVCGIDTQGNVPTLDFQRKICIVYWVWTFCPRTIPKSFLGCFFIKGLKLLYKYGVRYCHIWLMTRCAVCASVGSLLHEISWLMVMGLGFPPPRALHRVAWMSFCVSFCMHTVYIVHGHRVHCTWPPCISLRVALPCLFRGAAVCCLLQPPNCNLCFPWIEMGWMLPLFLEMTEW